MSFKSYFLVGGAGFVGSHFVDKLLSQQEIQKVTIYDNFSSGKTWHYQHHLADTRLHIVKADVKDFQTLTDAMRQHDIVMHFASNPDISKAATDPTIDFSEGILLTQLVLEAMRLNKIKRIVYISGSGVYGDVGETESSETDGSMHPISTYGASKLAGEAFISSYCYMFGMSACIFRFGNVVGARQTHGVAYDFINKLKSDSSRLVILGNGLQSKSYVHIDDIIEAVMLANDNLSSPYEIYNVATGDYITVREIADIVVDCLRLKSPVLFEYTGGDRGWKGDVPVVRLNTQKIQSLGWICKKTSTQAIKASVNAMLQDSEKSVKTTEENECDNTTLFS